MSETWNTREQEHNEKRSKAIRTLVSTVLGLGGLLLLLSQLFPLGTSYLQGAFYEYRAQIMAAPLPDAYKKDIEGEFAFYDPGASYFQNLTQQAGENIQLGSFTFDPVTKELKEVTIDQQYSKDMKITIDTLGIKDINISSNVESVDEDVYNLFLKKGVAHFKGTPLPGDGGNSFIYGHSAVPSFFDRNKDLPETIFSRLDGVDVGNDIVVRKDGKDIRYVVRSKKIIEPSNYSVLQSQGDKETVTLMTCWPLGVPAKRLIVVAERYE